MKKHSISISNLTRPRKNSQGALWSGNRYHIARLCNRYCLVDRLTDDPDYLLELKTDHGTGIIRFEKILLDVPPQSANLKQLKASDRALDAAWTLRQKGN